MISVDVRAKLDTQKAKLDFRKRVHLDATSRCALMILKHKNAPTVSPHRGSTAKSLRLASTWIGKHSEGSSSARSSETC